jgi:hypothetical protein
MFGVPVYATLPVGYRIGDAQQKSPRQAGFFGD